MYRGEAFLLAIMLTLWVCPAAAGDRFADIRIEADDAELDRRTGLTRYRGNVLVTQADLEIRGGEMTLQFVDDELAVAAITGAPATLTQGDGEETVRAEANEITFTVETGIVRLRGSARVTQGSDEFTSDDISFDTRSERVVAGGDPGGRIQVTITPRRPADDEEGPDDPEPRE